MGVYLNTDVHVKKYMCVRVLWVISLEGRRVEYTSVLKLWLNLVLLRLYRCVSQIEWNITPPGLSLFPAGMCRSLLCSITV